MIGRNNVLNIRSSTHFTWEGQIGSVKGFCSFEYPKYCRRAGCYLLMRSYRRAGLFLLEELIKRWAPDSENPTRQYIDFVCKMTGFKPTTRLTFRADYAAVLAAMEIFERGIPFADRERFYENAVVSYLDVIDEFNLKPYES